MIDPEGFSITTLFNVPVNGFKSVSTTITRNLTERDVKIKINIMKKVPLTNQHQANVFAKQIFVISGRFFFLSVRNFHVR